MATVANGKLFVFGWNNTINLSFSSPPFLEPIELKLGVFNQPKLAYC